MLALYDGREEALAKTVDVFIHKLRRKLPIGSIVTVRWVGYSLTPIGAEAVACALSFPQIVEVTA